MAKAGNDKTRKKESRERSERKQKESNLRNALLIAVPAVLAFAIFFFIVLPTLSVPFSTFKDNFLASQRVALVASYTDPNQSGTVLQCATQLVQVVAHSKNATAIDFYVFNDTACTYPVGGLGHTVTLATNTIQNCINMTRSEPTIFLNYSSMNSTSITPYKLYIGGDTQYMAECPIAVDLS